MKNALITGATKGMGRAIAIAFAREGANLAVCARNEAELTQFKQELLEINSQIKVFTQVADGGVKKQLLKFAGAAEHELGFIGIVVNNLGMFDPISILDESEEAFDKQLNTNLMPVTTYIVILAKVWSQRARVTFLRYAQLRALDPDRRGRHL